MNKKILVLPEVNIEFQGGGSYAVSKNTYLSDKSNFFNYIKVKNIGNNKVLPKTILPKSIIKIVSKSSFLNLLYHIRLLLSYYKAMKGYNIKQYHFIISHNILQTFVLILLMKKNNILYVHHLNGTYYNEYLQRNGKSIIFKIFCNYIEKTIFLNSKHLGFPSKGAKDNFGNKKILIGKNINYFYNGVDYKLVNNVINDKYTFITVLDCTKFKGIDRIVKFLYSLKKNNLNFHWTYVGKGPLLQKIHTKILEYKIDDNVTLISNRIPKNEIIQLMSQNRFYIGFHRTSIFDYATLEAMSQGCIPILTNVGGNKEVIIDTNGLLLDESSISNAHEKFTDFIKKNDVINLKQKNIDIVKNNFSSEKFINNYINFIKNIL